ncbi:MAG: urea ABC transporter permease subunit UrtB [Opitutaceae bacterium]
MKFPLLAVLGAFAAASGLLAAGTPPAAAVRRELTEALLARGSERLRLIAELGETGSRTAGEVLTAWTRDEVYLWPAAGGATIPVLLEEQEDADGRVRARRIDTGQWLVDAAGRVLRVDPNGLNSVDTDMRLRGFLQQALDTIALSDPDAAERRAAAVKLGYSGKLAYIPVLQARLRRESDADVRRALEEGIAQLRLGAADPDAAAAAAGRLAELKAIGSLGALKQVASDPREPGSVRAAAASAAVRIEHHISAVNFFGTLFQGVSLGSILLVVSLGLAITFGLMGVINMAHGEMIAIGAYTSYFVQKVFGGGFSFLITLPIRFAGHSLTFGFGVPGLNATGWWYQSYFLFVLPLSFLTAALAGAALEVTVIRFLYRRPLESLLATWGVSLVLQQIFRMVFGANNVQVNSPTWLLGHFSVDDVSFDYNRLFVIAFAGAILGGTALLLARTRLGLLIRAVMQNREMASCLGVRTGRVNLLTFAFGSGLAGLAGAFLSQIGNVGPSLGQSYIIDAFMVVVAGGVGHIAGTAYSALGIGASDQILEQVLGSPVLGKIIVLTAIILFLQKRPGGLFASRSRNLDD